MRLIDADALETRAHWECFENSDDDYEYVLKADIDLAPTIEAELRRENEGGRIMTLNEAISTMHPCDTCERSRYPEKFCKECQFNRAWYDHYKRDLNLDKILKFMEASDAQDEGQPE